MNIWRLALTGAAVGFVIYELTRKRKDGTSILDQVIDKGPEWFEKSKNYATQAVSEVVETAKNKAGDALGSVM